MAEDLEKLTQKLDAWKNPKKPQKKPIEIKGLHEQDQGRDQWARTRLASRLWLVTLLNMSQRSQGELHLRHCVRTQGAQEIQWHQGQNHPNADVNCQRYFGKDRPIDGRTVTEVQFGQQMLKALPSFRCLGDMLLAGDVSELTFITRATSAWNKFSHLSLVPHICVSESDLHWFR